MVMTGVALVAEAVVSATGHEHGVGDDGSACDGAGDAVVVAAEVVCVVQKPLPQSMTMQKLLSQNQS